MSDDWKRRVALVGTGHRGAGTWGKELLANCREWVELVGLADKNSLRVERARNAIGTNAPTFTDAGEMLAATRPQTLIVCTRDDTHADLIVAALEAGVDVVTEKPMATTAEMCRRILDAERRTGRRVDVGFNYRFSPTAEGDQGGDPLRRDRRHRLGRFPLVSRYQARRRLFPPLARLRRQFRQPLRPQGDASFRPA